MKLFLAKFSVAILMMGGPAAVMSFAQSASQDARQAGSDVKNAGKDVGHAAKDAGRATAKTTRHTAHRVKRGTKKGIHKGAQETGKAANHVERKTE